MLELLLLLQVKHFICDFILQTPYQYKNKGTWGHPGGVLHASIHVVASFFCLFFAWDHKNTNAIQIVLCAEFIIHYHVDWAKMNINASMGWKCNETDKFWVLMGFDQLLHQLTYVWMIWMVLG